MLRRKGFLGTFQVILMGSAVGTHREQRGRWRNKHLMGCPVDPTGQSIGPPCLKMSFKKVRKVSHTSLPRIDPHKEDRLDGSIKSLTGKRNQICQNWSDQIF